MAGSEMGASFGAMDLDDGVVFNYFKRLPLEIRSMIWKAAAIAAKPNCVYHFTYQKMDLGPGPQYPHLSDTVLTNLHKIPPSHPLARSIHDLLLWSFNGERVLTFTPSATVAELTRGVRDVFRSCSEARTELMRSPMLRSSFDFHYNQGDKCNLGTIRPFFYDTDWISMDGLNYVRADAPHEPGTPRVHGTPDMGLIQHFAFTCAGGAPNEWARDGTTQLDIFRLLDSLKSVGLYQSSFRIKRVSHWDGLIQPHQRLFLKGVPTSMSGPVSGPQLSRRSFRAAMTKLRDVVDATVQVAMAKNQQRWHAGSCDFGGLKFCLLIHADSQKGLDLMEFKEDGSHFDNIDLDDMGLMGATLKFYQIDINMYK